MKVLAIVLVLVSCKPATDDRRLAALERRVELLESQGKTPPVVQQVQVQAPIVIRGPKTEKLEAEESFVATLTNFRVTECTSIRCRYDWIWHIENRYPEARGFFGSVEFRDQAGYVVAKHDVPILRPLQVSAMETREVTSFMYLEPEAAKVIRTVEMSLAPIPLQGTEGPSGRQLEWHGTIPR